MDNIRQFIKEQNFKKLFVEELGWDNHSTQIEISVNGDAFSLTAVAEKRGMAVFVCVSPHGCKIPLYPVRRKIDQQLTRSVREHILIFTDSDTQVWQWVKREPGKPAACREHTYRRNQDGEALIQKLRTIAFSLDEEETLTLVEVAGRTRAGFDIERVTKRFYERFKNEHDSFLKLIKGIPDSDLEKWYASVMLNRLMFIYFIQKKGFLDGNADYLRSKLKQSRDRAVDEFYSGFLCPLFFEGFAKKKEDRSPATNKMLGKIPYLNGGLFLRHQIEELHGKNIEIPDRAFEKLFDFFENYQWHLDERPLRKDNEINPDVLGYIFEKYINQKQMGAYYTKEDITEYISKNTVIPFLFDSAKHKCKIAFDGETAVWKTLNDDPDRYIYDAVKHGISVDIHTEPPAKLERPLPLPEDIAAGINDVSKRTGWNRSAPAEYALPTEIWREVVARRQRYDELVSKMRNGEVRSINDLITYNLDIRQFAEDVIVNTEGPELLRAFYHAIENVTVLDPTCGSGAFLFAALNILEPLYEACLDRMQAFLDELERSGEKHRADKYSDFRKILKRVSEHPNLKYFIYKSIIVNNLYGVDIMEEAVEICKLRLFLKLVAQTESTDRIEPLPDIDFNIRAGNTLVGFATYQELKQSLSSDLLSLQSLPAIEEKAEEVDRLFKLFHEQQTELGGQVTPEDKQELRRRLKVLEDDLNSHLAKEYGIDPDKKKAYQSWLKSHQPFHWFIEFYGIMKNGGFDVIIGNPPYVELSKVNGYVIKNVRTTACGNLYCPILERSLALETRALGRFGMIIPLSLSCTERMHEMRTVIEQLLSTAWLSHYSGDANPSKLFEGVKSRLDILLGKLGSGARFYSSPYLKWFADERPTLFSKITYEIVSSGQRHLGLIPKTGSSKAAESLNKILQKKAISEQVGSSSRTLYVHRVITMWIKCFDFVPYFRNETDGEKKSEEYKPYMFKSDEFASIVLSALNTSTFFFYFATLGDCFHCGKEFITSFPLSVDLVLPDIRATLNVCSAKLMLHLKETAVRRKAYSEKTGALEYDEFWPRYSKPIIDEIDRVLAKHYGFTDEELDFIINYDIKYRMGRESDTAESE